MVNAAGDWLYAKEDCRKAMPLYMADFRPPKHLDPQNPPRFLPHFVQEKKQ
jgi:hypothetical protein